MTPNHLRSVIAQVSRRNFSTGCRCNLSPSRSTIYARKGARFLTQFCGLTLGLSIGNLVVGDVVSELEKKRLKDIEEAFGWVPPKLGEDLREKMWPELREMMWFQNMKRMWSDKKEKMFPGQ